MPRPQVELPGESQGAGFKSALGPSSPRRLLRWWGRYRGNMNAKPGRVIPGFTVSWVRGLNHRPAKTAHPTRGRKFESCTHRQGSRWVDSHLNTSFQMGRGVRTSAPDQPVRMALPAVILTPGLDMGARLSLPCGLPGRSKAGVASGVERISVHRCQ